MNTSQEQTSRTAVFDEKGQTVEDGAENTEVVTEEMEAAPAEEAADEAAPAKPEQFRIGDRTFATQEEMFAYVQSLESEKEVANAYRQGMLDARGVATPMPESVTPAAPKFDTEQLYTNPDKFLTDYAAQIKADAQADLDRKLANQTQSEQIWREFTDRHPELADFRNEVENFVQRFQPDVVAIIQTKGRPAGYDYVATKLKSEFARYAEATKPKRTLPNTNASPSPSTKSASVTPKVEQKKPLNFHDQLRSIRKRR